MGWKILLVIMFVILVLMVIFCLLVLVKISSLTTDIEEQMEIEKKLRKK